MRAPPVAAALALAAALLAGCTEGGHDTPTGTLALGILDDAPRPLALTAAGAYARAAPNGTWAPVGEGPGEWAFSGSGAMRTLDGPVPAGDYQGFRILLERAEVDGDDAVLAQSGVELPLPFTVPAGGRVEIVLELSWEDALYESAEGPAFTPALAALELRGPGGTARLEANEIGHTGKAPVARMRVFDGKGLQAFASDFVADDAPKRVIANAGRLTFSAGDSEAVDEAAELSSFEWDFGDGATATGATVFHDYPLAGGNRTVRLTVTDSKGTRDTQRVDMALKPGTANATFRFSGTATGVGAAGTPVACGPPAGHPFDVATDRAPDGSAAILRTAVAFLVPNGTAHALANLDLRLLDGAGATIAEGTSSTVEESLQAEFDPEALPAAGAWSLDVLPCAAAEVAYASAIELTWQGLGDPGYEAWLATYDDGHSHQH